ncbi:hypothetical protein QF047_003101 [Arthrobacter sp. W4I7]|nr:hypothetical protein [Arthrobacter sp. W4I7]
MGIAGEWASRFKVCQEKQLDRNGRADGIGGTKMLVTGG